VTVARSPREQLVPCPYVPGAALSRRTHPIPRRVHHQHADCDSSDRRSRVPLLVVQSSAEPGAAATPALILVTEGLIPSSAAASANRDRIGCSRACSAGEGSRTKRTARPIITTRPAASPDQNGIRRSQASNTTPNASPIVRHQATSDGAAAPISTYPTVNIQNRHARREVCSGATREWRCVQHRGHRDRSR